MCDSRIYYWQKAKQGVVEVIRITCVKDLDSVTDSCIKKHIESQLKYLLNTYKEERSEGSIESIGAIFYVEKSSDFDNYTQFGLSSPITEKRFECIVELPNEYYRGLIIINNSKAIELIGRKSVFNTILKEENQWQTP